jgi:hypothetical protein
MVDDNQTIGIHPLIILHQIICGLRKKIDVLINSVFLTFLLVFLGTPSETV